VPTNVRGDSHAAEDAAQHVFLTLANRANALRTRTSVAGWLYRTAWNVSTRQRREQSIRCGHESRAAAELALAGNNPNGDAAASAEPVPFAVITSELSDALAHALGNLPENYRNALVLHHLAGYTVAETAGLLEVRTGTAASWLSRGRAMLRERLQMLLAVTLAAELIEQWLAGHKPGPRHLVGDAPLRNWNYSPGGRRAIATAAAGMTPVVVAAAARPALGMTVGSAVGASSASYGAMAAGIAAVLPSVSASGATVLGLSKPVAVAGAVTVSVAGVAMVSAPYVAHSSAGAGGAKGGDAANSQSSSASSGASSSSSGGGFSGGGGSAVPEPTIALPMLLATIALVGMARRRNPRIEAGELTKSANL
jgi:RNA polymerase sigma factor (sigma-70 family)